MSFPQFTKKSFLQEHIKHTLSFYEPSIDDPKGGFFQNFSDDGSVFDASTRHLVSSTRFVFNYARAYLEFGDENYLKRVYSGIDFIRKQHYNPTLKSYKWMISVGDNESCTLDDNNHCYGYAFVMLAYSWAMRTGHPKASEYLEETWQTMESVFWDESAGLYKDEFDASLTQDSGYRGQNANMHSCEALIAAYHASQDKKYLDRALLLADNITNRQANLTGGLIWEHFKSDWSADLEYNKNDPKNLFRPWGFQPGHQTEWSKLLVMLYQITTQAWLLKRAIALFDKATELSWDQTNKGLCYGFDLEHKVCDGDKYFWVQAETFAAAAFLYTYTHDAKYLDWYTQIWEYSWDHLVDHEYGAWFRILTQDNQKIDTLKSPIGKTDYHTMGACYDVMSLGFFNK